MIYMWAIISKKLKENNHVVIYGMEKFYFVFVLITFVSLVYLSWQDIKEQQISRNITLFTTFFALLSNSIALMFFNYEPAYQALLGGGILGAVFLLYLLLTKEKALGMGDVFLFMIMGLLVGLQNIILSFSIMVFSALLYSVIKYKNVNLKQKIPLVPFITLGIFSTILILYLLR
jgi:prepilin signal peptidase PulO-like enzyme (type II secretory pathway)